MLRAQSSHPLDPLSAAEIAVAVATVRAAGATPEVCHYNPICFFCFLLFMWKCCSSVMYLSCFLPNGSVILLSIQVRDSMRFVEVVLLEPEKHVVALADAYFFPPFQPSLLPRIKGGPIIPSKLPPRRARLIVYNKKSNETSKWIVELTEVHATTRGGHHRGKVVSTEVVRDVQPPMVCLSFLETIRLLRSHSPYR